MMAAVVRQLAAEYLSSEYWHLLAAYPEISTDGYVNSRDAAPVELADFIFARLFLNARGPGGDLSTDRAPLSFGGRRLTMGGLLFAGLSAGFRITYENGKCWLRSGGTHGH